MMRLTHETVIDLIADACMITYTQTGVMPDTLHVHPDDLVTVGAASRIWGLHLVGDPEIPMGTLYVESRNERNATNARNAT